MITIIGVIFVAQVSIFGEFWSSYLIAWLVSSLRPSLALSSNFFDDLWSGACLGVLAPVNLYNVDNLMYGAGGKKVVNNETGWFEIF